MIKKSQNRVMVELEMRTSAPADIRHKYSKHSYA